jgi:hypothetical protein
MADRQAQIPKGPYLNDVEEAALYQRQIPGGPFVNETQQAAGGGFVPYPRPRGLTGGMSNWGGGMQV